MSKHLSQRDLSILIGNSLDHFDTALYGFLAPIIGRVFFPSYEPVVQVILAYSILTTSLFTRPLGAFIFGIVARNYGPVLGLSYSLVGVAGATLVIGFLPDYESIGWIAPCCLVLIKMMKSICASGESTIAKLYIMEDKTPNDALQASYLYQTSSILGIITASAASTLVIALNPDAWRVCFWAGGMTGLSGYLLRRYEIPQKMQSPAVFASYQLSSLALLWSYKSRLIRVVIVTGVSHLTYTIPFVFMNSFIPLITQITLETMMKFNTVLLVFDGVMIPLLGNYLKKYEASKIMMTAALVLSLTIIPLFWGLKNASIEYVIFVRLWIVMGGVVFLCPLNFWLKGIFEGSEQYFLVGIGNALSAAIIGRLTTPLCLWGWHISDLTFLPAVYMGCIMLGAVYALRTAKQEVKMTLARTHEKVI